MTSKGSLAGKRKFSPLLHEILWTVRRYWWVTVVGMLLIFLTTYGWATLEYDNPDTFKLMSREGEFLSRIIGVLYGIFAAFCMFRFLWSRRECGMTLSVGVTRWKQFTLRYVFGLLSVMLAVVVPLILAYYLEMRTMGEDPVGVCAHYTAVLIIALFVITALSYTVGVLIVVLCGHFLPAMLSTVGVLAAPYAFLGGVQKMLATYLFGTAHGQSLLSDHLHAGLFTMLTESVQTKTYMSGMLSDILSPTCEPWLPDYLKGLKQEVSLPTVRVILLLLLTLGLALLACRAYCRRPAEHAGKAYVHPLLTYAVALTCGFGLSTLVLNIPVQGGARMFWLTALLVLAFFAAFLLLRLILVRNLRDVFRGYAIPCGATGLCLLLSILLGTGWFGYSDFVPDMRDVSSVTVSCEQDVQFLRQLMHNKGGSLRGFGMATPTTSSLDATYWAQYGDMKLSMLYAYGSDASDDRLPAMTEKEDIQVALDIHNAILAEGRQTYTGVLHEEYGKNVIPVSYRITYRLKNGKTVERYYEYLTIDTLEKTFEAYDTKAYRSEVGGSYSSEAFENAAEIQLGDPLFGDFQSIDFTQEERDLLAAALGKDMANMTVADIYFGTDEKQHDNVIGIIRAQNISGYRTTETHPFDGFYVNFYITALHENTLAFLEERGLTECFTGGYTVTDLRTQLYEPRFTAQGKPIIQISQIFYSCDNVIQIAIDPNFESDDQREHLEHNTTPVPATEWDTYIQNSRSVALLTRPGRMVQIILTNAEGEQKLVTRYIYESDIPTGN